MPNGASTALGSVVVAAVCVGACRAGTQTPVAPCAPWFETPLEVPRRRRSTENCPPTGASGEQGLQQVDYLLEHLHPLPRHQHLLGMAMAWLGWQRPVALGLKVQGQLRVGDVAAAQYPLKRRGPRPPRSRAPTANPPAGLAATSRGPSLRPGVAGRPLIAPTCNHGTSPGLMPVA